MPDLRPWSPEQWREHWTGLALQMWTAMRKALAAGDAEVARLCIGQAVSAEGLGGLDASISAAMREEMRGRHQSVQKVHTLPAQASLVL